MLGLNSPNRKAQPSSIYLVQYGTPAQFLDYLFLNDWWINLAVTLISPGQSHLPWSWYRWLPQPRCWKPWRALLRLWPLWAVWPKQLGNSQEIMLLVASRHSDSCCSQQGSGWIATCSPQGFCCHSRISPVTQQPQPQGCLGTNMSFTLRSHYSRVCGSFLCLTC